METHSLARTERPEGADGGPEIISRFRLTIRFSPFIWAVMPLGHRDRNHARKPRTSLTSVMKTGVRFRRWPGGAGAAGAEVVPTGVPLRGPDMSQDLSCDMRLLAVSREAAESDESDSMAMGLSGPLCGRAMRPAATAAYAGLCFSMLLIATCPSVAVVATSCSRRRAPEQVDARQVRWRNPSPIGSPFSCCPPGVSVP
jgi:hypothetical protein